MRRTQREGGSGRLGCLVWLFIVAFIGYGLYKIIPVKIATSKFYDFMQEEASFASIRNPKQLKKEILAKAKELDLPVTEENLTIKRPRESITIEAHYEIVVETFWKKYIWKFDQVVERPTFLI